MSETTTLATPSSGSQELIDALHHRAACQEERRVALAELHLALDLDADNKARALIEYGEARRRVVEATFQVEQAKARIAARHRREG